MNIDEIIGGLNIIKNYYPAAPIVTSAYRIDIPLAAFAYMSGPDQTSLTLLNWWADPNYGWCSHWVSTITEVKYIDGSKIPSLPTPIPVVPVV